MVYFQNDTLPKSSHVVMLGLADGRLLWNMLHDRFWPLGELRHDVTYEHFYDWFNCLEVFT